MRRLAARARDRARQHHSSPWYDEASGYTDWRDWRPWEILRVQRRHVRAGCDRAAWAWLGLARDAAWLQPVARGGDPLRYLATRPHPWGDVRIWTHDVRALRWLVTHPVGDGMLAAFQSAVFAVAARHQRSVLAAWAVYRLDAVFDGCLAADCATASRILRRYVLARTKMCPRQIRGELDDESLGTFAHRHRCWRYLVARLCIA